MKQPAISTGCFALATLSIFILSAGLAFSQTKMASYAVAAVTQDSTHPASAQSEIRGSFPCVLSKSLDSKKLKEGETVVCDTAGRFHTEGGLLIPSESKVTGHVTQAQARSKGDPQSSLAMVFDKIEVTKGEEIPIKGVLQAIAPSLGNSGPDTGPAYPPGMGRAGAQTTTPPPTPGPQAGPNAGGVHPLLNSESKGVLGFHNLQMDDNSVITSTGKEVKLDNGTQMMIRAE